MLRYIEDIEAHYEPKIGVPTPVLPIPRILNLQCDGPAVATSAPRDKQINALLLAREGKINGVALTLRDFLTQEARHEPLGIPEREYRFHFRVLPNDGGQARRANGVRY